MDELSAAERAAMNRMARAWDEMVYAQRDVVLAESAATAARRHWQAAIDHWHFVRETAKKRDYRNMEP